MSSIIERMTYKPRDIVKGYTELVQRRIEEGWEPTFMSFMFNHLRGGQATVADEMRLEIERVFGWMLTRRCRRPRTTPNHDLPLLLACPDWPVPKCHRDKFSDIVVNGGRHAHRIDLTPPGTRLVCTLSDFVAEHQSELVGPNRPLARVFAETITKTPERAVGYVLKSLPRGRATGDDLIVLPRAKSEPIPSRG